MKLIVGLGNVGNKYLNTRHNIGFRAIDFVAKELNIKLNKQKFNGIFYKTRNFILAKPHTFMNLSGDFVYDISHFYKIKISDILIIHDDMDLSLGKIRHRPTGSSGGHNGMDDVMVKLDTNKINRLKIGIGRPEFEIVDYVLSNFTKNELEIINKQAPNIVNFVINFISIDNDH